ncbi:MAG: transposase [Reyranella sp.]|nr:transposase [Reyranella sp.]
MSDTVRKPISEPVRRLEIFTGAGRRRKWSAEQKAAVVAESLGGVESVSAVARRHGLTPSQLFGWRRQASGRSVVPEDDAYGMPVAKHQEGRSLRASNRDISPVRRGFDDDLGVGEVLVTRIDKPDTYESLRHLQGQFGGKGRFQPGDEGPQVDPADRKECPLVSREVPQDMSATVEDYRLEFEIDELRCVDGPAHAGIFEIEPTEIVRGQLAIQNGLQNRGLEAPANLLDVVPFHPGCPLAIGACSPGFERHGAFAEPPLLGVHQFDPASADFQATEGGHRLPAGDIEGNVVDGADHEDGVVVGRQGVE